MQGSGGISFWLLGFLQDHFQKPEDLASINSLTDRLKHQFGDHEIELLHLQRKLSLAVSSWISKSYDVGRILSGIESSHRGTFRGLPARSLYLSLDDMELLDRMRKSYFWSYPCLLMRFVASSQSETALHLETLVGDLEDAALAMLKQVQGRINSNTGSLLLDRATNLSQDSLWMTRGSETKRDWMAFGKTACGSKGYERYRRNSSWCCKKQALMDKFA